MQLAGAEADIADDLVQDAYVQFTVSSPDLDEIGNLDGYLYGIMRNLRLSQIRRDARQRLTQLSVIEWHLGTGATDNASGVAVMMEAVRLIKALGLKPRRTIRIAFWSGEDQGRLGSLAYVNEQFGPTYASDADDVMRFKPAYDKFVAYFNLDHGTGAIRGIPLEGNEALRPIFREWFKPFRELKIGQNTYRAETISAGSGKASDYQPFDAIGLVGLDFIQDEIEYAPRTWHTNQDTFDRLLADHLKQASAIVAAFAYNASMTDEKLPLPPRVTDAKP